MPLTVQSLLEPEGCLRGRTEAAIASAIEADAGAAPGSGIEIEADAAVVIAPALE